MAWPGLATGIIDSYSVWTPTPCRHMPIPGPKLRRGRVPLSNFHSGPPLLRGENSSHSKTTTPLACLVASAAHSPVMISGASYSTTHLPQSPYTPICPLGCFWICSPTTVTAWQCVGDGSTDSGALAGKCPTSARPTVPPSFTPSTLTWYSPGLRRRPYCQPPSPPAALTRVTLGRGGRAWRPAGARTATTMCGQPVWRAPSCRHASLATHCLHHVCGHMSPP